MRFKLLSSLGLVLISILSIAFDHVLATPLYEKAEFEGGEENGKIFDEQQPTNGDDDNQQPELTVMDAVRWSPHRCRTIELADGVFFGGPGELGQFEECRQGIDGTLDNTPYHQINTKVDQESPQSEIMKEGQPDQMASELNEFGDILMEIFKPFISTTTQATRAKSSRKTGKRSSKKPKLSKISSTTSTTTTAEAETETSTAAATTATTENLNEQLLASDDLLAAVFGNLRQEQQRSENSQSNDDETPLISHTVGAAV